VGCSHQRAAAPPRTGAVVGLARDHDSGEALAKAEIRLRAPGEFTPRLALSGGDGRYALDRLPPGTYDLTALFAGQPLEVVAVEVRPGATTTVDLTFTLGRPDPIHTSFGDPREGAIDRYRPRGQAATIGRIEGIVGDTSSRARIGGAVVTVIGPGTPPPTYQMITDDAGRYAFEALPPARYTVSAYYSVDGRGQIEVRRSEVEVGGGDAVIVPLWIETAGQ
jgi:mannose-6-phosphate isomerase-like protein (cupin superfamily)